MREKETQDRILRKTMFFRHGTRREPSEKLGFCFVLFHCGKIFLLTKEKHLVDKKFNKFHLGKST